MRKGLKGFEFVIKGNAPVAISSVDPGGVAEAAQLMDGDAILQFNDEDVTLLTKDQIVAKIVEAGASEICLCVVNLTDQKLEQVRKNLASVNRT